MTETTNEMVEMLSRIKSLVKLYNRELEGHIEILLAGDFKISDEIFGRRQALDREIKSWLITEIGKK